ncbi:MAG: double zinc ribbon domain-containing protein [Verrucomicrobiia bacterium]|jgi:competence protein ComFC
MGIRLGEWGNSLAHFVFPETCQVCGERRAGPATGYVCEDCWQGVRLVESPFCDKCGLPFKGAIDRGFECANCRELDLRFDFARSAALGNDFLREIIHRFKYDGARYFGTFLGELLSSAAGPILAGGGWDEIVPVPLHRLKLREREFNQADQLARFLSDSCGIPSSPHRLIRTVPTQTQTRLSRRQRTENVKSAFVLGRADELRGKSIVLLDDVLTTGATTSACARVLKQAGAERVCVWTVARATFAPQLV